MLGFFIIIFVKKGDAFFGGSRKKNAGAALRPQSARAESASEEPTRFVGWRWRWSSGPSP